MKSNDRTLGFWAEECWKQNKKYNRSREDSSSWHSSWWKKLTSLFRRCDQVITRRHSFVSYSNWACIVDDFLKDQICESPVNWLMQLTENEYYNFKNNKNYFNYKIINYPMNTHFIDAIQLLAIFLSIIHEVGSHFLHLR